ncbi:MAG: Stp1/IreP family PP2C-type Ser/Thr phosphatase [Oscillospiraceae bacterium]|jgi:protein phosphatase|nr:Stp1/IreP family PP2C-type Ser/Thr phosphatase [Oscillospiraceae bacterium]
MEIWGKTDVGAVRRQNQDAFAMLLDEDRNIAVFVVCDGMGGARAGNIASGMAVERFMERMRKYAEEDFGGDMVGCMSAAIAAANKAVYDKSISDERCMGMGTTLVAAAVTRERCVVMNIGDSRAYKVTGSSIVQVTRDHSVVEDMIDRGDISRQAAKEHPKKNLITRALGTNAGEMPDIFSHELREGDSLLLCSDGLSNTVEEREIFYETAYGRDVRGSCERLIGLALARGAPDNATVVLFRK